MNNPNAITELPTVAANAIVLLNRAELCAHLPEGVAGVQITAAWRDFTSKIDAEQPRPELN